MRKRQVRYQCVKRGRLSAEEKQRIEGLALAMKVPRPGPIAAKLDRNPSTVGWYMLRHGLLERPLSYQMPAYRRGGVPVNPYSPAQDKRLIELRRAGLVYRAIAETLTREFGIPRNLHSVQVRHIMLSAAPNGPEDIDL